jgi:hypothetical protein
MAVSRQRHTRRVRMRTPSQHADAVIAKVGPVADHADFAIQNVNGMVGDVREPLRMDLAEVQKTLQQASYSPLLLVREPHLGMLGRIAQLGRG